VNNSDIPSSWTSKRLGELSSSIQYGYTAKAQQENVGPKLLRITDIQDGAVDWDSVPTCRITDSEKNKYLLTKGDLVFARTGATVGKSYLITGAIPEAVFASYLIRVRLREEIDPKYVSYFFKSLEYWRQISENQAGIGQPNVNGKKLSQLLVPVAPRNQQNRIVSEIEKQFSRLDEAVANLKRVKANLKRYKAAVLKAAVEGKLTEEWRKANKNKVEPLPAPQSGKWFVYVIECEGGSHYIGHTNDIQRRFNAHCDGEGAEWTKSHPPKEIAHWEEFECREDAVKREKELKTGFGRKWLKREIAAGRTKRATRQAGASELLKRTLAERRAKWNGKGKYGEAKTPDTLELPPLPEGWVWARLDAVAALKGGITVDKNRKSAHARMIPYLRVANVQRGYLDLAEVKKIEAPETAINELRLEPGDVLFTEGGDRDKLGRGWIWEGQLPECIHQNHVFVLGFTHMMCLRNSSPGGATHSDRNTFCGKANRQPILHRLT
jgi:predicted GIY-YIG superfamily endonuclease